MGGWVHVCTCARAYIRARVCVMDGVNSCLFNSAEILQLEELKRFWRNLS